MVYNVRKCKLNCQFSKYSRPPQGYIGKILKGSIFNLSVLERNLNMLMVRWLGWLGLGLPVWMLRLMMRCGLGWTGFNVWVLGDVRAQAVSLPACPDILEPRGAGSVVTITKYFLISTQFLLNLYQLLLSPLNTRVILPAVLYGEGREGGNHEWFRD